jgi:hypothetical protein
MDDIIFVFLMIFPAMSIEYINLFSSPRQRIIIDDKSGYSVTIYSSNGQPLNPP